MPRWLAEFEMGRRGRSTLWALGVCLLFAVLAGAIVILVVPGALESPTYATVDYGLMIDAGSSGSRIFVFQWHHRTTAELPQIAPVVNPTTNTSLVLKVAPGLSSYQSNITAAGLSLKPLVEFAKQNLPENRWSSTPIFLEATAGLRKLPIQVSDALIQSARNYLSTSPFLYKESHVRMVSGQEEAINSWLTVNDVSGTIGAPANQTIGIVEIGGASLQVAFVPSTPAPANQTWPLTMDGVTYQVYTQSYLFYGLTEAKYRLNESLWDGTANSNESNPCFLPGYSEQVQFTLDDGRQGQYTLWGTGDFDACVASAVPLLNLSVPCADPPCLFNGVHQPPLRGSFHGVDNFAKALVFFNLPSSYSPDDLADAARPFCAMNWANATATYPSPPNPLQDYCFMAGYLYAVLSQGLQLAPADNTTFDYSQFINGTEVSWTFGAMTLQVDLMPWSRPNWFADPIHLLAVVGPPVLILGIALALVWLCYVRRSELDRNGYDKVEPTS